MTRSEEVSPRGPAAHRPSLTVEAGRHLSSIKRLSMSILSPHGSEKRPRESAGSDAEFQSYWGITRADEDLMLGRLRTEVEKETGPLGPLFDDMYLCRFLRARQHDVDKAKAMFMAHLAWRKQNHVDGILENFHFTERDAVLSIYPQGYHKTDKKGRPVYIQHLGQINFKTLTTITTEERMLKYHIQEYERCLKYIFPICSKIAGHHISTTMTILDLKGVGLRQLTGETKRILNKIVDIDSSNYPETLGETLIINAPSVFKMLWAVVKPMLDTRTQSKIKVAPSNYLPELLKLVDAENIPAYLGGTSKGSLVDDVGPWQDPELVADVDAEWAERRGLPAPKAPRAVEEGGGPTREEEEEEEEAAGAVHRGMLRLESSTYMDAEEFSDLMTRRESMMMTPTGEGSVYSSPRAALPSGLPSPEGRGPTVLAGPSIQFTERQGSFDRAFSGRHDESVLHTTLQIPILARVRSLEEKFPELEVRLRKQLPAGQPAPSKAIGTGTLLSRVDALERAMDTLIIAQEMALQDSRRHGRETPEPAPNWQCCSVM